MSNKDLWEKILAEVELEVGRKDFSALFIDTRLDDFENGTAVISCRNDMERRLLAQKYSGLILNLIEKGSGKKPRLKFTTNNINKNKRQKEKSLGPLFTPSTNSVGLDPLCTLENFAVSDSNQLAHAAAQAVIKNPGKAYNPLFIWGGVGVGKTHLMQAIGHEILKRDPAAKVIFCMGEEFTNGIIDAIRNKTTSAFKRKYRSAQLLILDDVQFIAGKIKVQEEFFHTFVSIKREGGQILLTSDRAPQEIPELEGRLRSRFEAGLSVDVSPPDFELRTAIVLIKAKQRGKSVSMDVARFLADNIDDTRRLEGVLMRVLTEAEIMGREVTVSLVESIVNKVATREVSGPRLSAGDLLRGVSLHFGITLSDLKSKKRSRPIAIPRQIAMYLMRESLKMSLQDIGSFLGGRDHTTIMHGVNKVKNKLLKDPQWGGDILGIKSRLLR
jgi:chromosomal replication initiator protein